MTQVEMAQLLAYIRTFDNRVIDDATVVAWHDVIGDLDLNDCIAAVRNHFRETREYLKIADIAEYALTLRKHRLAQQRDADEALKELAARAERGDRAEPRPTEDRSADVAELVQQIRTVLPAGDRKALRYEDKTLRRYQPRAADVPNDKFTGWRPPPPVPGDDEAS